jgi:hypothetical protein
MTFKAALALLLSATLVAGQVAAFFPAPPPSGPPTPAVPPANVGPGSGTMSPPVVQAPPAPGGPPPGSPPGDTFPGGPPGPGVPEIDAGVMAGAVGLLLCGGLLLVGRLRRSAP